MRRTIALLTDFGLRDSFVGVMKGVIARISPEANVIDISHAAPAQDVRAGALMLLASYRHFPTDAIFVAVVDPGVGGARRPMAVRAGQQVFIAPDNGILSYVLQENQALEPRLLDNPAFHLPQVSNTFHGRDIFAPTAAHLASGAAFEDLGSPLTHWHLLEAPVLSAEGDRLRGEVLHIDHFGNVMTSIGRFEWLEDDHLRLEPAFGAALPARVSLARRCALTISDTHLDGVRRTYGEAYPGAALALIGSSGFLELSINLGSFAEVFDVHTGDSVILEAG
ncbi:MAG: SAM-dependent chlorinase/fluorinase [Anaerolineae bacterium]|nr:SAM-dependent chlorinase/fluorinase [Anaerolineae bacterium]NUQ02787.1 SAM-dependent chlorinase/fluorinase [Anaerolineae bacterium]